MAVTLMIISCDLPPPVLDASDPVPVTYWWERHAAIVNELAGYDESVDGVIDILFIGDSLIQLWETDGIDEWNLLKADYNIYNLGMGGDSTGHVIYRLYSGEFPDCIKPRFVVLLIGSNNGMYSVGSSAKAVGDIIGIIHRKSKNATIILTSVLPRGDISIEFGRKILDLNDAIKPYGNLDYAIWFDLAKHFTNSAGGMKMELFDYSKVHLSPLGYKLWREELVKLLRNFT
ncbi:MAG: GDSL-type esterase/lipase family protein [Treponema sp.]|jgi:lysophospholipase L1-like esterase|nr:GDSL-type esterase/lipase family protein [Treponema sp.]